MSDTSQKIVTSAKEMVMATIRLALAIIIAMMYAGLVSAYFSKYISFTLIIVPALLCVIGLKHPVKDKTLSDKPTLSGLLIVLVIACIITWNRGPDFDTGGPTVASNSPVVTTNDSTTQTQPEAIKTAKYTEKDFYWDKVTTPWKQTIIKGVNKVQQQNPRCAKLDPSSAYVSKDKGTKKNPVFYVTCEPEGEEVFNYFFSKTDVDVDSTLAAAKHIDQMRALNLCEQYAKTQAHNPQTVKFSKFWNKGVKEYPNGRTRLNSTFEASNLMGVEMKFKITCLFDERGFIEGEVTNE